MRVLLTNDDGFFAAGINLLKNIIKDFASEIWIFAPENDCSGASRSVGLRRPIKVHERDQNQYSIEGTPTECVIIALEGIIKFKPDLILSGINHGANIGNDVMYSGTVAAAMEGAVRGIPSIAFSQSYRNKSQPFSSRNSENLVIKIIDQLLKNPSWKKKCVMNVNFPSDESKGIRFTNQGKYPIVSNLEFIQNDSYIIHRIHAERVGDGSIQAILDGYTSITPLQDDLTDYNILSCLS